MSSDGHPRPSVGNTSGSDGLGSPSDLTGWPAWSLIMKKLTWGVLETITKCVSYTSPSKARRSD